jgi:hypothetical protein
MDRHEITLTRIFRNLVTPIHPNRANPFWAFATIFGVLGRGKLQVIVSALDQPEVVYDFRHPIEFKERLSPIYLKLDLAYCRFPREGPYEIMLIVDGDIIAQRVFFVSGEGA